MEFAPPGKYCVRSSGKRGFEKGKTVRLWKEPENRGNKRREREHSKNRLSLPLHLLHRSNFSLIEAKMDPCLQRSLVKGVMNEEEE